MEAEMYQRLLNEILLLSMITDNTISLDPVDTIIPKEFIQSIRGISVTRKMFNNPKSIVHYIIYRYIISKFSGVDKFEIDSFITEIFNSTAIDKQSELEMKQIFSRVVRYLKWVESPSVFTGGLKFITEILNFEAWNGNTLRLYEVNIIDNKMQASFIPAPILVALHPEIIKGVLETIQSVVNVKNGMKWKYKLNEDKRIISILEE